MEIPWKRAILWLCLCVAVILFIVWVIWSNHALQTSFYTVSSRKIPDSFSGFRILQISDLHNTEFGKNNRDLINSIALQNPDIIVITGDLADSRNWNLQIAGEFAKNAANIAPVYYISGNHEGRSSAYQELEQTLIAAGVTVLNDEAVLLENGVDTVQLIGLQDMNLREVPKTDAEILSQYSQNMYSVVLVHDPARFPVIAASGMDLVLSGHVHGGQFRIPFLGGLYAPGQGIFPKYDAGLYTENGESMIVSRGLGNSAFPVRINNRPEIVVVDLMKE